jgi:PAS domain S-box-containing protein
MEFLTGLFIFGTLYGFSVYLLKRRYSDQLLTEQNRSSSLEISESQLRQKNQHLSEELTEKSSEAERLKGEYESLSLELSQHVAAGQEARSILDSLSHQLSKESTQRASTEEQLNKTKEMVNAASAQLKITVEERMRELQQLQSQLHNENAARKHLEEIVSQKEDEHERLVAQLHVTEDQLHRMKESLNATSADLHAALERHKETINQLHREIEQWKIKEADAQKNIAGLNGTVLTLQNEVASLNDRLSAAHAARDIAEREKTTVEKELVEKVVQLESQLTVLTAEHQQVSDSLQEETGIRIATEHALQESKDKLYALIHDLEAQLASRNSTIASQNDRLYHATSTVDKLNSAVHSIISQVPIPVFVVNEQGICSFVNESLHAMVGYDTEDIAGRHFSKLFPEQERQFYEEQWNSTADRTEQFKGETHIATVAGDTMTVEINFVSIETEEGRSFVGCIADKTHEREAAHHYSSAKKREEELRQLKSRFISMVTDHLRAALVTVATNTELLERFLFKWPDEKRYRAFFRINESLKQMLDLLRNVETSTASTVNFMQTIKPLDLETVAQSVVKEVTTDLDAQQRFILSEQGSISSVPMDERIVRTVLYHTLSNAFTFSAGTDEVKMHIGRNDGGITFVITDHGIGIPSAEQHLLFSSFFRGSNVGNVHGTGLGLTIVQQYVQLAGGTVAIDSELNKGTKVTITLPVRD